MPDPDPAKNGLDPQPCAKLFISVSIVGGNKKTHKYFTTSKLSFEENGVKLGPGGAVNSWKNPEFENVMLQSL